MRLAGLEEERLDLFIAKLKPFFCWTRSVGGGGPGLLDVDSSCEMSIKKMKFLL
jgi:hypothetical protein